MLLPATESGYSLSPRSTLLAHALGQSDCKEHLPGSARSGRRAERVPSALRFRIPAREILVSELNKLLLGSTSLQCQ
jgi:hypothetical protein